MNSQDKILRYGFTAFSAITSFLLLFYAVNINFNSDATHELKVFSYATGGYGLLNIYMLSWAWRSQAAWTIMGNMAIAVCFFGVFTMATISDGLSSSLAGIGTILALACVLTLNWFTIKKLCKSNNSR